MKLAVCSMQKNRGPWILEWVAFHHLMGFTDFIIYLHNCEDDSADIVARLSRLFRITSLSVNETGFGIQLKCFQHAYAEFAKNYDWLAFLDGDEFLFSPHGCHISSVLARYQDIPISALAVYWRSFGASGHIAEPKGLVTQNYRYRGADSFIGNRHIKSIVRSGAQMKVLWNAHCFATELGTVDEKLAPITAGFDPAHVPSWDYFCINHYSTQSRQFYEKIKRASGAADSGPGLIREESWWEEYNRNEILDNSLAVFQERLAQNVRDICIATGIAYERLGGLPVHLAA